MAQMIMLLLIWSSVNQVLYELTDDTHYLTMRKLSVFSACIVALLGILEIV